MPKSDPPASEDISNVILLVRKPLGVGDLIMISPLVSFLEKKFVKSQIYLATEHEKFIDFERACWIHPDSLDRGLFLDSMVVSPAFTLSHLKSVFRAQYYIGYFFSNRLISNFASVGYKYSFREGHYFAKIFPILDALSIGYDKKDLPYPMARTDKSGFSRDKMVVLAPYSNWPERQFPIDKYADLIQLLLETSNNDIVLIGSNSLNEVNFNKQLENMVDSVRVYNQTGSTNLVQASELIAKSKLYIGNDSGPSHIAYMSAARVLVFFGSVRFEERVPLSPKLKEKIQCIDSREECNHFPCYNGLEKPKCINNQKYSCIANVSISAKDIKGFF